jgi:nucleotide-binding universal stress UspA family protein
MYKKILIATDGTQHSTSAIIEAIDMSRKFGSEIYLLHALKKIVASDPVGVSRSVITEKIKESTKKYMETFKGLATDDGVMKCEIVVSHGREFHEAILEEAEKRNVDLIMIGRSVSNVITRIIYKGVTTHLLKYAPCNVLIVPLASLIHWQNIVLLYDNTKKSSAVAEEALRIAKKHGSKIIIILLGKKNSIHDVINQADKDDLPLEVLNPKGKLSDFVLKLSKERDTDIIITRSPEEGGVKDRLKKSFTEQIITRSICSVLVVKGA